MPQIARVLSEDNVARASGQTTELEASNVRNDSAVAGDTVADALTGLAGSVGAIPLVDGTQALPSLSFAADLDLGMFRIGANRAGMVQSNVLGWEWGNGTQLNVDPVSPSTVRYTMRGYQNPLGGVNETTFLYARIDPGVGTEQQAGLYVDITSNQLDTYGPGIKVIHAGAGDGIYVAQFGNGSAYEAASWADGSRGYISTIQVAGLPNSTLFNALWDQADVPNFGMFYADLSTANALTIRKRDATAAAGNTQIRLINQAGTHQPFAVYSDGATTLDGPAATVGTPEQESPELRLFGHIFNGGVDKEVRIIAKTVAINGATGRYALRLYAQTEGGAAVLLGQWHDQGELDLQNHALENIGNLQAQTNLDLYAAGELELQLVPPNVNGETAMLLTVRDGGVNTLQQVTVGAADSGGVGFRALVVPN
jgi:hypothetical protein